jgi:hypothetical protein
VAEHHIKIVVGDDDYEGHGKSEIFIYTANYSFDRIDQAYDNAASSYGLDLIEECKEEDNGGFTDRFAKNLLCMLETKYPEFVSDKKNELKNFSPEGTWYTSPKEFAEIYLMIASLDLTGLKWHEADIPSISLGGYGLFMSE